MATNPKTVTVTITTTTDKRAITLAVSEEPVQLNGYDGVDWEVDAASVGWTFTRVAGNSTGVKIKNGQGRFNDNGGHGTTFRRHSWDRVVSDNRTYQYTISVTNETTGTTTPTTLSWDPTIHNN